MKERGMIFNGEMVRAILDGRKTQTRRIMKVQPENAELGLRRITDSSVAKEVGMYFWCLADACGVKHRSNLFSCPFGVVGDRIWVRETFATLGNEDGCAIDWNENLVKDGGPDAARIYRASCTQGDYGLWQIPDDADWKPHTEGMQYDGAWTPSIHMPRWASRITLEITGVRVERLQDISEEDAEAEGIDMEALADAQDCYDCIADHNFTGRPTAAGHFSYLWQSIYGAESWQANPWVWVVEFMVIGRE